MEKQNSETTSTTLLPPLPKQQQQKICFSTSTNHNHHNYQQQQQVVFDHLGIGGVGGGREYKNEEDEDEDEGQEEEAEKPSSIESGDGTPISSATMPTDDDFVSDVSETTALLDDDDDDDTDVDDESKVSNSSSSCSSSSSASEKHGLGVGNSTSVSTLSPSSSTNSNLNDLLQEEEAAAITTDNDDVDDSQSNNSDRKGYLLGQRKPSLVIALDLFVNRWLFQKKKKKSRRQKQLLDQSDCDHHQQQHEQQQQKQQQQHQHQQPKKKKKTNKKSTQPKWLTPSPLVKLLSLHPATLHSPTTTTTTPSQDDNSTRVESINNNKKKKKNKNTPVAQSVVPACAPASTCCSSPVVQVSPTLNAHLLDAALALYRKTFPGQVEMSISEMLGYVARGTYRIMVLPANAAAVAAPDTPSNEVAAAAFIALLQENASYCHLDYVCVNENYRGKGLGTAFFRHLATSLATEGKRAVLTLECEHHLIGWYKRLGGIESGIPDSIFPDQKDDGPFRFMAFQLSLFSENKGGSSTSADATQPPPPSKPALSHHLISTASLKAVMAEVRHSVHNMSCAAEYTITNEETHESTRITEWV